MHFNPLVGVFFHRLGEWRREAKRERGLGKYDAALKYAPNRTQRKDA
jgi:hypothetical protein